MENIPRNIIEITSSISIVIALLLILSNRLDKKYHLKWRYWIWMILSIRLILPFSIIIPEPPIRLPAREIIQTIENKNIQDISTIEVVNAPIEPANEKVTPPKIETTGNDS